MMLSSLSFPSKTRSGRNSPTKYFEVSKGFSAHGMKSSSPPHPYGNGGMKHEPPPARPPSAMARTTSTNYPPRPDVERKASLGRSTMSPNYDTALVASHTKSRKNFDIYPNPSGDMFIYERSVSAASDGLASSNSSSSTDSEDSLGSRGHLEVSSTRASSSTETLETTALSVRALQIHTSAVAAGAPSRAVSSGYPRLPQDGRPPLAQAVASAGEDPRYGSATFAIPLQFESLSDSDSDTIIEEQITGPVPARRSLDSEVPDGRREAGYGTQPSGLFLPRRDSDGSTGGRVLSGSAGAPARYEDSSSLRAPPGLSMATSYDGGDQLRRVQPHSAYSVPPPRPGPSQRPHPLPGRQYDPGFAAPQVRAGDGRPLPQRHGSLDRDVPERAETSPVRGASLERGTSMSAKRGVRWAENLILPSAVPRAERRKGWFNCRGDQLWTNAGSYKAVEPGGEYPPDLTGYPEPSCGWMNEEGIRIDMEHRLIPKPPLRPALKRHANTM